MAADRAAPSPAAKVPRLRLVHAEIEHNLRAAGYALANGYLNQQRVMAAELGMTVVELTIFLTVLVASVQRLVRQPDALAPFRARQRLPEAFLGSISRRAIAEATGIPRETVRRVVAELIARGYLIEAGPRGVTGARGSAAMATYAGLPALLAAETQRTVEELQRLRVLVVAP